MSVLDEALDFEFSERLDYAGTRDLEVYKHKIKPGAKPVYFHVREVPHSLWEEYVDAADSYPEKHKRAFMCGLERVENLPMGDGVQLGTWVPSTKHARSGQVILSVEDLKLFAPAYRTEIGSVIYAHSFLPRAMQITYLLPLSLQEPLVTQDARRAVQSQRDAEAKIKSAPSVPSAPSTPPTERISAHGGANSDSHTDAVAAIQISP